MDDIDQGLLAKWREHYPFVGDDLSFLNDDYYSGLIHESNLNWVAHVRHLFEYINIQWRMHLFFESFTQINMPDTLNSYRSKIEEKLLQKTEIHRQIRIRRLRGD